MKFFGEEAYSSRKTPDEFFGVIKDLVARVKETDT
jgi:hypothetical protein